MIVHHPGRLHERVTDRRSDKREPTLLQILTHGIALLGSRRHLVRPAILHWPAADETPDVGVKRAKLFLHGKERLRIAYSRINLQSIPPDPSASNKGRHFSIAVARHLLR